VRQHGAASDEIDRFDLGLGSPPHALVVATASGFDDSFQPATEEVLLSDPKLGGTKNPDVRADMVFFECPKEGAVFSIGTMSWFGALSYNNYDNTVSRVTENVLRRFVSDEPWSVAIGPAFFSGDKA
jgi:N,N-dimethylformamidase